MTSSTFGKRSYLLLVAISFFFHACVDPKLKEAGAFAAGIAGGSEFEVKHRSESTGSIYELTVDDAAWNKNFDNDDVLSVCALAFYNRLEMPETNAYVRLVLHTDRDVFQQTYTADELQRADRCIDRVSSFFKWEPALGIDSLKPFVDPLFFPDSLIQKIGESVHLQDSVGNGFVRAEVIGFESDTVAGMSVLTVKVNAVRKQSRQRYDAVMGLKNEQILLVVPAEND